MSENRAPRPGPPAGRTTIPAPLTSAQYARREALRMAVDLNRSRGDAAVENILDTARAFAEFITREPKPADPG